MVRAKQHLRDLELEKGFDIPDPEDLPTRLGSILEVLYLMFTEEYSPADGDVAVRDELCREALRLARLLTDSPRTDTPRRRHFTRYSASNMRERAHAPWKTAACSCCSSRIGRAGTEA